MVPQKTNIRLILFADTHLGFDYPVRPRIQRRRRGTDFFDNFKRVLRYAVENRADFIVHGGDFFFRSKIPSKIVDLAYQMLFAFSDNNIPFIIVPGNHERSRLPSSILFTHPHIHIFDRPKTLQLNVRNTRIAISGFPFERNNMRDRFLEILKAANTENFSTDIRLLCMHQAVQGARVGPANYTFRYGRDVIRMKDIPSDFLAVLCGHIHRQQILLNYTSGCQSPVSVIYPGSIERTSFAEKSEEKGFFELEFYRACENRWKIHHTKFIPLPARPMADVILNGEVNGKNIKDFILTKIASLDPDSIIRLKVDLECDPAVMSLLTSAFLRDLLPKTMNFQFSTDFYRNRP